MRREKEEGKRAQNYTGKAARTIRHHKQRGKEAAKKNGSTLDNFFLHKQKKAPPERTPTLVNTETSTLAATEVVALEDSSIGWNSNTNEVHINVDPVAIGGELLSNDAESIEEEPEEVLMQADNHVPEVAQHQSPTVLHPNDAEGEDPDDIHQDLWKDHQLMVSVEKRLTQAEREHHNKMEKLLGARLVAMKSLIHFYTSEDYQLTGLLGGCDSGLWHTSEEISRMIHSLTHVMECSKHRSSMMKTYRSVSSNTSKHSIVTSRPKMSLILSLVLLCKDAIRTSREGNVY